MYYWAWERILNCVMDGYKFYKWRRECQRRIIYWKVNNNSNRCGSCFSGPGEIAMKAVLILANK